MGAGKTTAGRKLAGLLGYRFTDIDSLIEAGECMPVSDIFRMKGEEWFREKESEILKNLSLDDRLVVATGGGLPCFHNNMEWMNSHGVTVYLRMDPDALYRRLLKGRQKRPLIKDKSGPELLRYIQETLKIREPFYLRSHLHAEGKNLDVKSLAQRIMMFHRPDSPSRDPCGSVPSASPASRNLASPMRMVSHPFQPGRNSCPFIHQAVDPTMNTGPVSVVSIAWK